MKEPKEYFGGLLVTDFTRPTEDLKLFEDFFNQSTSLDPIPCTYSAKKALESIYHHNNLQHRYASRILDYLDERLLFLNVDTLIAPPLFLTEGDDGVLLFEWIFPHFRAGFSIEPNVSESGWFLVSDSYAGNVGASGFLTPKNYEWLIQLLITAAFYNHLLDS